MNAATRVLSNSVILPSELFSGLSWSALTPYMIAVGLVLISAFSIVYVTNYSRNLFIASQNAIQRDNRLHVQRGKLLLEQSTWAAQSRVARLAKRELHMMLPKPSQVKMVEV